MQKSAHQHEEEQNDRKDKPSVKPSSKSVIRIGTWNLEGKWSEEHRLFLHSHRCDIWLLTEVSAQTIDEYKSPKDYYCHFTADFMAPNRHWAAVLSKKKLDKLPAPHEASVVALFDGIVYCSSILPWASCGSEPSEPWRGATLAEKTEAAIEPMKTTFPKSATVWGGDWNQNLFGGWEHVGSSAMREKIESVVESLGLKVATRVLAHRIQGSHTIDHIAIPFGWDVCETQRVSAKGLSDHDAYFIDAIRTN